MRTAKALAACASFFCHFTPGTAQNGTANGTIDIAPFANSNLTTVDLEYSVYTDCGPADNVTIVRQRVSYVVVNGLALVDGDILYGTEAELLARVAPGNSTQLSRRDELLGESLLGLTKRALSPRGPALSKWPAAEIPYTFSSADVSTFLTLADVDVRKGVFRDAVKVWKDRLPWLNMYEIDDQNYDAAAQTTPTRLTISLVDGCVSWSPVGRAFTQEASVLAISCPDLWLYLHEIGHTLGLHHEHQRPDRDKYFDLDCTRITDQNGVLPVCSGTCQGWGCQFEARTNALLDNWEGPYDTNSVMHYQTYAFSKDSAFPPLIGRIPAVQVPLHPRPSFLDLVRVCEIYSAECFGKGICGDGVVSPNNGEECDPGCEGVATATCTTDCKLVAGCGNGRIEGVEECDDGPAGSATCTVDCRAIPPAGTCIQTCDPDVRFNRCDQTTSCIAVEGGTAASAGKHYCACRHGFRTAVGTPQMRLPWYAPISQEGRVFVEPAEPCNLLCDAWTLGKDGCKEVDLQPACY